MSQQTQVEATVVCSQCGRTLAPSDVVQIAGNWVCANCKPAYLGRVVASGVAGTSPRGWRYGGVAIRFAARFVDGMVLGIPLIVVMMAVLIPTMVRTMPRTGRPPAVPNPAMAGFLVTFFVVTFVVGMLYEVGMLKSYGATLGKMACGLKVVRADGSELGWGVCFGRFFMWNVVTSGIPYLNFILMLVTVIVAGTDAEKRAIHDRVCGTRVVYKSSIA